LRNLTATWLAIRLKNGDTRADALRWLNGQARASYTSSRLNEWLRGDREPGRDARIIMLRECLPPDMSRRASDLT
jgi:hypothetical protein